MKKTLWVSGSLVAALAADAASLSRAEIEKKLEALAKAPAPTTLAPGAMCYAPPLIQPQQTFDFVCSSCGEKTVYPHTASAYYSVREVESLRRQVQALRDKGLDCRLDDTAFCAKCGKSGEANKKQFSLVVKFGNAPEHRVALQGSNDLALLQEFLDGKAVHDQGPGGEKPLKDQLPRLRQLLGVESAQDATK